MTGLVNHPLQPLTRLQSALFETPGVLKKTATAGRRLAELKGLAASMPNQAILINTLGLQEAKDSSAIENIVTTHDERTKASWTSPCCTSAARSCAASPTTTACCRRCASRPTKRRFGKSGRCTCWLR